MLGSAVFRGLPSWSQLPVGPLGHLNTMIPKQEPNILMTSPGEAERSGMATHCPCRQGWGGNLHRRVSRAIAGVRTQGSLMERPSPSANTKYQP